jgi:hypothetical protein
MNSEKKKNISDLRLMQLRSSIRDWRARAVPGVGTTCEEERRIEVASRLYSYDAHSTTMIHTEYIRSQAMCEDQERGRHQ